MASLYEPCNWAGLVTGTEFVEISVMPFSIRLISTVSEHLFFSLCLDCSPLAGSIDNGYQHGTGSVEGSLVWFSCIDGYSLNGNQYLHCNDKGNWNGTTPSCLKGTVNSGRFSLHYYY